MQAAVGIFSVTVFPLVMASSVGVAMMLMSRGMDPYLAIGGPILGAFLLVVACEPIFPHSRTWLRSRGDVRVDAAFAVVDLFVERAASLLLAPVAAFAGAWFSARAGIGLWPSSWPLVAQLVLALVYAEFFKYWGHRFMHEWDWLWRFHATHHSVPRLYWLNASRFHPVDLLIDTGLGVGSLAFVGCPAETIALFVLVTGVHGVFQHSNLRLRLGVLNWFFSMAELHRWHHSRNLAEANNNYGNNVIVWDIVFGTRYLPADREPPLDVGLADLPAFPKTFVGQMLSPLRWRRIRASSAP